MFVCNVTYQTQHAAKENTHFDMPDFVNVTHDIKFMDKTVKTLAVKPVFELSNFM